MNSFVGMIKSFSILFICICTALVSPGQSRQNDSLRQRIANSTDDKERIEAILSLSGQSINADTLYPYVLLAESISRTLKDKMITDKAAMTRAFFYIRKNYVDSALTIINELVTRNKNGKDKAFYLSVLFFKARALDRGNRYTQALTQLHEVLEIAEEQKDTLSQIMAKTGIGWVQMEMAQYPEALQWLYRALNTSNNKKFYKDYGALYSNIASTYNALGKPDSAKAYINTAINDARKNNNLLFLANALSMQAKIFIDNKEQQLAESPLHEIVEIRRQLNDPFYTVFDMSTLASFYANNNQTEKGIALCKEGIALAQKSGLSSQLLMVYNALAENYKKAGNTAAYSNTLEDIIALKDSFNNINSSKLLADMESATAAQKRERTIIEQELNLTRKNYWLFASVLFTIMAGIIVWLAFKNYNRKQNIRMQLALEEEKRIAAQSIIDAEEQERKRIAADLHDNIGAYASAIRADVEKIADSGFKKDDISLQNLQQHSAEIINSLRDTIWVLNRENITITGISDRIKNYAGKLQPTYDHIQFHISEEIKNDLQVNSQHALNIFRIVQEAIHNALKHSGANNIMIGITSDTALSIKIGDDGKGMEPGIATDGNGLLNMKARAREMGMQLSMVAGVHGGTVLILQSSTTN
jgi:signal transduction histidine kinase